MAVVESSMHFLTRDELYEHEKPYQLKYAAPDGVPRTNLRLEKKQPIRISNIRDQEQQLSFEKNGFTVLKMDKDIPYDDFFNPTGIRRYLEAVAERLKVALGADRVQVFQYLVRSIVPRFVYRGFH